MRHKRVIPWLMLVIIGVMSATAALAKPEATRRSASLVGQLLVASPKIGDPRFEHAVILIVAHNKDGTLGIMVNRPVGDLALSKLLEGAGEGGSHAEGAVRMFAGGPVQPALGFVLHSPEYRRVGTLDVDGRVAMTATPEVLRDIAQGKGPEKRLIAFGYTGWGAGQLENEIAKGAWFTAPDDPKLVFDEDRDKLWDAAMARRTLAL